MSQGEHHNNSKNTIPVEVAKYMKQVRRNTITHEFDQGLPEELLLTQESDDQLSAASSLLRQGIKQQKAGDVIAAIQFFRQSLEMFQLAGDVPQQEQVLSLLALVTYTSGDYKSAITYSQQCLALKNTSDPAVRMQVLSHLGNAYRHLNNYSKAVEFLEECLKLTKQLQDKRSQVAALNNLGLVYKASGNFLKAIEYQEQSLEIVQELQDNWG